MDQSQFTSLTGLTLETEQYDSLLESATADLEDLLGYPLDPSSWTNLYNETGKTQSECTRPDVDTDLDDPDPVIGSYRLFRFNPTDRYLAIDPATAIHRVKLVKDDIALKTYEERDYRPQWRNGSPRIAKYIELCDYPNYTWWWDCRYWRECDCVQLAVDATWAYAGSDFPKPLERVLAQMIAEQSEGYENQDIKSESRGSHSFTKESKQTITQRFPQLMRYAGPNGTLYTRTI